MEIYLDNGATTKVCPEAAEAALNAMTIAYGNPSSTHTKGREAKKLLDTSMALAAELGAGCLCITGNILFYGKSGFRVASSLGIRYAEAEADDTVVPYFLAKELQAGYLQGFSGSFREPEPYFVCETDPEGFAAFDATFPEKDKLVLPGQLTH